MILQVVKGTVDQDIHSLAERKLQLDAAVLKSINDDDAQLPMTEAAAMQQVLQGLLEPSPQVDNLNAGDKIKSQQSKLKCSPANAVFEAGLGTTEHADSPDVVNIDDD